MESNIIIHWPCCYERPNSTSYTFFVKQAPCLRALIQTLYARAIKFPRGKGCLPSRCECNTKTHSGSKFLQADSIREKPRCCALPKMNTTLPSSPLRRTTCRAMQMPGANPDVHGKKGEWVFWEVGRNRTSRRGRIKAAVAAPPVVLLWVRECVSHVLVCKFLFELYHSKYPSGGNFRQGFCHWIKLEGLLFFKSSFENILKR